MKSVAPRIQLFLDHLNQVLTPALMAQGFKRNPINAREALAGLTSRFVTQTVAVACIQDDTVSATMGGYNVPVRIYHPEPQQALPIWVYLHGGGGMCGSVSVYDGILRRLAVQSRHIVVAPEYRLAPECPYPAGETDALTVVRGVRAVLQQNHLKFIDRIAVGGDSAGGALASAVALRAQTDVDLAITALVLIYPSVDFCMSSPSIQSLGCGYMLTAETIRWYFENYFQHGEDYCAASSLHAPVNMNHVPTLVLTAGYDPLRDEGAAYAQKLEAAGVPVEYHCFESLIHAFLNMEDLCIEEVQAAYGLIHDFLNTRFEGVDDMVSTVDNP